MFTNQIVFVGKSPIFVYFSKDEQNFCLLVKDAPKNVNAFVNVQVIIESKGVVAGIGLALNSTGVGASVKLSAMSWNYWICRII